MDGRAVRTFSGRCIAERALGEAAATKFNGVAYIIQRAAEAALSDEDARSARRRYEFTKENAHILSAPLDEKGESSTRAADRRRTASG